MSSSGAEVSREDLHATLAARQELGEEYEPALVDALAERVERVVEARVEARLAQRGVVPPVAARSPAGPETEVTTAQRIGVAVGSLGLAIPLTGIAGGTAGVAGMAIAWAGIVLVNVAFAVGAGRRGRP
jgi:hypothetical protein